MHRGSNPPDWPLPGYPGSYLSQLKLKVGNYPELGFASTSDLLFVVETNVRQHTSTLTQLLTRHGANPSFSNLLMAIPLFLTVLRTAGSLWSAENSFPLCFLGVKFASLIMPSSTA